MLLITDPEVRQVLKMRDCIEAMERAFAEEARGIAVNKPRTRYKVPPDLDKPGYMANIIPGAVPSSKVAALRYDSTIVQERVVAGGKRMDFPSPTKRSWARSARREGICSPGKCATSAGRSTRRLPTSRESRSRRTRAI